MKKAIIMVLFAIAMFAFICCKEEGKEDATTESTTEIMEKNATHNYVNYICPMDCEKGVVYENEGLCPVCEMDLVDTKKVLPWPEK